MSIEPIEGVSRTNTDWRPPVRHMVVCRHRNSQTGQSYIVLDDKKFRGSYPRKYRALCTNCMKEFELTQEQYDHYLKTGELHI